jgi:superfamily II DNA or RNA helicase
MNPGSIVRCRHRDWVLLPDADQEVYRLRPLTGATDEVAVIHKRLADLIGYELPDERVRPATFPPPAVDDLADAASAHLLWQAARLTLREGASPLRSLGRISLRPRIYQFVPLLMALRLAPVRMLIADDVGVGKTIEALLIARELLDRGEIRRLCVLCPPYLCDQWQRELADKFNLDAVIIRSGTVGQLERNKPTTESIYRHYPIQVASIDFLKSDRNKHLFLLDCPELVIVDEAHGVAVPAAGNQSQHQRRELVEAIAARPDRHLLLLTATPHSGIESAFRSLLALLRPEFAAWDMAALSEVQRSELARHFVQRTRRDIEHDWEGDHCFPTRMAADETYRLSPAYQALFTATYDFCAEMVRSGQTLDQRRQRVRYWGALALLRCVMSSPAAALAALTARQDGLPLDEELEFGAYVFEAAEEQTNDEQPTPPIEAAAQTLAEVERRRLRELSRLAQALHNTAADAKLTGCVAQVAALLRDGHNPIVWCRYIATAEYLASALRDTLQRSHPELRVVAVTGRLGDDERRVVVEELMAAPRRVLVATDCLSEGVNLQEGFDAALHYDLPWNPNRLEQREGRVDRYGQRAPTVKTIRYFSPDSAGDGVVIRVLLDKAREIHRSLGTYVPVPEESETVTQAVLNALFLSGRRADAQQLHFEFAGDQVNALHARWDGNAERERINRSRFAQRALKPGEVRQELEATDAVLGDPDAVRAFVLDAAQRLGLSVRRDTPPEVYRVAVSAQATAALPDAIRFALPAQGDLWRITFVSPTPEGAEYVGRNHRFVAALAHYLLEEALTQGGAAHAARCGVIRTLSVPRLTTLLLLRVRYLLQQPQAAPLLAEEVLVLGYCGDAQRGAVTRLPAADALALLRDARPDANLGQPEKRELAAAALADWPRLEQAIAAQLAARAAELEVSHKRVRQAVALRVRELNLTPQAPPDLVGVLVLQPVVTP